MPSSGSKKGAHEGRHDCDLCHTNTEGQRIFILYDSRFAAGQQVIRGHLTCLQKQDANKALHNLTTWKWDGIVETEKLDIVITL